MHEYVSSYISLHDKSVSASPANCIRLRQLMKHGQLVVFSNCSCEAESFASNIGSAQAHILFQFSINSTSFLPKLSSYLSYLLSSGVHLDCFELNRVKHWSILCCSSCIPPNSWFPCRLPDSQHVLPDICLQ